eukprot:6211944-Pleurochrysis_carterae.AAC.4
MQHKLAKKVGHTPARHMYVAQEHLECAPPMYAYAPEAERVSCKHTCAAQAHTCRNSIGCGVERHSQRKQANVATEKDAVRLYRKYQRGNAT